MTMNREEIMNGHPQAHVADRAAKIRRRVKNQYGGDAEDRAERLVKLDSEITSLWDKINPKLDEQKGVKAEVSEIQGRIEKLEEKRDRLKAKRASYREVRKVAGEIGNLKEDVGEAHAKLREVNEELSKLFDELHAMDRTRQQLDPRFTRGRRKKKSDKSEEERKLEDLARDDSRKKKRRKRSEKSVAMRLQEAAIRGNPALSEAQKNELVAALRRGNSKPKPSNDNQKQGKGKKGKKK